MKKILTIVCALILILTSSCTHSQKTNNDKLNIVCSVFPQYDFTRNIAGEKANISLLVPPGAEAHSYEPSPKDILKLREADIFIMIGGESEHWAEHLLPNADKEKIKCIHLIDSVTAHMEEHTEGMEEVSHTHVHDNEHKEYDEHIWTSPKNAIKMCHAIFDALCHADAENKDFYKENLSKYEKELINLSRKFESVSKNPRRKTLVFGDRFPMRYLIEDMGIEYFAAFPGCSSKTEPSARTVAFLSDKVKEEKIPVVFYMDYSDGRTARVIANEAGAKESRLYSCHNLSKKDFEKGETYMSLMTKNLKEIKEALN